MNKKTTLHPEMRYAKGHFTIHLVNPTNKSYDKVIMETGAYIIDDWDDELKIINSETITKEFDNLTAQGELQIDRSDLGELDHTIWYEIKLFTDEKAEPEELTFKLVSGKIKYESK